MNTDNLILRETDNLPLINKDDTLTNAEIDANFINIYNDFISLSQANDPTLMYDVDRSYSIGEFATYDGRMWVAIETSTGVTPIIGSADWDDVFPTVLAHEKNKDTILDEGGTNETTVAEIRAFIDAGLTSTTNLSLSTKTGTSFKIESSTGTDVTIPQATNIEAGLLNATDKVKLDNTSGINTGDQTLITLNAEDVDNKVTDFTTINDTLYPTTQAVDTYVTAVVPDLVETFLDSNVELNTNKAITFAVINDTLYPSVKAVDDQLDLKVDKVVGERLITSSESTLLGNTSGVNTGDQDLSGYQPLLSGGITNRLTKWSSSSAISNSLIQDNGTTLSIGTTPVANNLFKVSSNATEATILTENSQASGVGILGSSSGSNGIGASFTATSATGIKVGVNGSATGSGGTNKGGVFGATGGVNNYSIQLTDGTQGSGKFLKSVTANGEANWVNIANTDVSGLGTLATQNGTFSGTSSGTNTGDQDLSTYQPYTTATTGSVISFVIPQVYNSVASPSSSNITDSLTSAKIGIVQKIYHNHTVAPTFPVGWVKMGTATYTTSTLNVIFAEWVSSTRVEYWITKPS